MPPGDWCWPIAVSDGKPSSLILRTFGPDSRGLDFRLARGSTVRAAGAGEIVYAGSGLGGYAYLVIVRHGERFLSAYGFNGRLRVAEGEIAQVGEVIAVIDTMGIRGAGLHFEIRDHGAPIDPRLLLP